MRTYTNRASFMVPYCVNQGNILVAVQLNPMHGVHLIGGKSEKGETSMQSLYRELREELGEVGSLLMGREFNLRTRTLLDVFGREEHVSFYALKLSKGEIEELVFRSDSEREFDLGLLRIRTDMYEPGAVSRAAGTAFDWLYRELMTPDI